MIPRFALARPQSLPEAFAAFAAADGDAAWYAGGTELLQVMKMGLARFGTLIDLKAVPELAGIARDPSGALVIGATVTHREVERSPLVATELPALAALTRHIANVRVRNQGTLGGNLCFAEPHSDPATFLLACDAKVLLQGPRGSRVVGLGAFLEGPFATAREPDEVLVSVAVPARRPAEGRAYEKVKFRERPAVSVAAQIRLEGDRVAEAAVAVGSLADTPVRLLAAEAALEGVPAGELSPAGRMPGLDDALAALDAVDDLDGSADYKRHLAGVLLGRALQQSVAEAMADA